MKISEKQLLTLIKVAQAYVDTIKVISTFSMDEARRRTELLLKQIHDQQSDEFKEVE